MKRFFPLFVMVALSYCGVSCSHDDDNGPDPTVPVLNEITLDIETEDDEEYFNLLSTELLKNPRGINREVAKRFGQYFKIPQDWEVDWGDGNTTKSTDHTYAKNGTYRVKVKGTGLTAISIDANVKIINFHNINVAKAPNLVVLDIGFYGLTTLEHTTGLTTLDVSNNPELAFLICVSNRLTTLDVSKNKKLELLNCGNNNLTSLDVSKNPELAFLNCGDMKLTSLDVSKNTELEYLVCGDNNLTSLDVSKNPELAFLNCGDNNLSSLDVSKNKKLELLDCIDNKLSTLDIRNNPELTDLSFAGRTDHFSQESVDQVLIDLPDAKYDIDGHSISCLFISDKYDATTAKRKGWEIDYYH